MGRVQDVDDRFWSKVAIPADVITGCWLWTRDTSNTYGYGRFKMPGRYAVAHRVAYESVRGPIGSGLDLDHLCRVRHCINPAHLEPVTKAENVRRGLVGQGEMRGERHGSAKLSDAQAAEIIASTESAATLAKRFGVHQSLISRIRSGKRRAGPNG